MDAPRHDLVALRGGCSRPEAAAHQPRGERHRAITSCEADAETPPAEPTRDALRQMLCGTGATLVTALRGPAPARLAQERQSVGHLSDRGGRLRGRLLPV
jgi:hypothetical protein